MNIKGIKGSLFIFLAIFLTFALFSCGDDTKPLKEADAVTITEENVDRGFSLTGDSHGRIYSTFVKKTNHSLLLFDYDINSPFDVKEIFTEEIDTIDISPSINPFINYRAGITLADRMYMLYADQQDEEHLVLKLVSKQPGDNFWSVQTLEPVGKPVTILKIADYLVPVWNTSELFFAFLSKGNTIATKKIKGTFRFEGNINNLISENFSAFTGYDTISGNLVFFSFSFSDSNIHGDIQQGADATYSIGNQRINLKEKILFKGAGRVHYSTLDKDKNLLIALYNEKRSAIELLKGEKNSLKHEIISVTPTRETNSIYMFDSKSGINFIFDEMTLSKKNRVEYQINLLKAEKVGYSKQTIYESNYPIERFSVVLSGNTIYILLFDKKLKLLKAKVDYSIYD